MLKLKERTFPSTFIRSLCCRVIGHQIADSTWTRWRSWKQVAKRARTLTGDEAIDLIAIALARSKAHSPHTQLKASEIVAQRPEASLMLTTFIGWLDARYVFGRNAIEWLSTVRSRRISQATLYRKIPEFSKRDPIPINVLWAISA